MPSRKKAKGKARKSAKEAKAKEEETQAVVEAAANLRQEESVEALLHRLVINAASPKLCRHGCPSVTAGEEKMFTDFMNAFIAAAAAPGSQNNVESFIKAHKATVETYSDVYSSKLDTVISVILRNGTQGILDGKNKAAQLYACLATYFEDFRAVKVRQTQATLNVTKIIELGCADDHTLVSYYKKRIPCSCLDEKYKEVKSVKKMGLCYNPKCSHPGRKVERSKMFSCTRCGEANYCSVACQKANWNRHREFCSKGAKLKAAFDSEQS